MPRVTRLLFCLLASPVLGSNIDPSLLQGLGDVRYHEYESTGLDRTFHVFVRLPEEYDFSEGTLPTVYLLDGGITFPLLSAYYRYLRLGEEVPISILVGIAYGTDDWQQGNKRSTDYTAPSDEREFWGGAGRFQQMLADELLPFIESTYRSDPARRVLFGQSLGGQFVLYTAQTRPDLFWGHIASNPALHRNLDFFLATRPENATLDRSKLFVAEATGDAEEFLEPRARWIEHWSVVDTPPWELEIRRLDGHSHFSAVPAAFRQGMFWLFAPAEAGP